MSGLKTARLALENLSDEALASLAQDGRTDAAEILLRRYRGLVCAKANPYFLAGAEEEDIIQEGMIGLYNAIMRFDPKRFPFFKMFASLCIKRHILNAVRAAMRKKHIPLNSYVSLDKSVYDEGGLPLSETADITSAEKRQNPETILIDRENIDGMEYRINKALSKLELQVLMYHLEGKSYREIADLLGKDVKSVDNAIQRIKKKVEIILNDTQNV